MTQAHKIRASHHAICCHTQSSGYRRRGSREPSSQRTHVLCGHDDFASDEWARKDFLLSDRALQLSQQLVEKL
jgi:hypothetical protein